MTTVPVSTSVIEDLLEKQSQKDDEQFAEAHEKVAKENAAMATKAGKSWFSWLWN